MGTEREVAFAFSAREVALLGRLPIHGGEPGSADHAVVGSLLEAVDCAWLGERVFATLSTGERQRVQLARALAQVSDVQAGTDGSAAAERPGATGPARYLLLDEPTSSLDPAHQHVAMRLLRRTASRGLGILAVLHDLNLAAAYADRIVLLAHGRVAAAGVPAEVLRSAVLEPVFELPMLVVDHPQVPHPIVVGEPDVRGDLR
jgi:iron complex transport system ATP-binding protein